MDGVDATDRQIHIASAPPPSLLAIVLDTNPIAWSDLSSTLSLSTVLGQLQIFINAHLAISHGNQVALLASHIDRAEWLYPVPSTPATNGRGDHGGDEASGATNGATASKEEQNKYRPFLAVEKQLRDNLQALLEATTPDSLADRSATQIAGALTSALTYINKQTLLSSPNADADAGQLPGTMQADGTTTAGLAPALVSRILIVSVSGDLSSQYISVMNAIFAAQRRHIPIDVLKLAGDAGFLQQACDATSGVYLEPERKAMRGTGLLQYLMMAYLPDVTARRSLLPPGAGAVDFRAACFCHRRIVDLGFVCSVCLSIFCEPVPDSICLTCGTTLGLPVNFNVKPAVIPRRKKKRKKVGDSGAGTPGPSTPGA